MTPQRSNDKLTNTPSSSIGVEGHMENTPCASGFTETSFLGYKPSRCLAQWLPKAYNFVCHQSFMLEHVGGNFSLLFTLAILGGHPARWSHYVGLQTIVPVDMSVLVAHTTSAKCQTFTSRSLSAPWMMTQLQCKLSRDCLSSSPYTSWTAGLNLKSIFGEVDLTNTPFR